MGVAKICVLGSYVCQMSSYLPHVPKPGETIVANKFDMGPGGKGNNVAIAINRLGGKSILIERLGEDIFGDMVLDVYKKENIDTTYVKKTKGVQSGIGLVYVQPNGENTAAYFAGANEKLCSEDIIDAESAIKDSSILYIQLEIPDDPILAAIDLSKKHGVKVVLNPAPARKIPTRVFKDVDIITPNLIEAMEITSTEYKENLTNVEIEAIGKKLLSLGPKEVFITLGEMGAFYINQFGVKIFQKAIEVKSIDTVGAGDSFNAALCIAIAEGFDVNKVLLKACISGALTTTKIGVIDALSTKEDIEIFLKNNPIL